jgi:hypothetical protein
VEIGWAARSPCYSNCEKTGINLSAGLTHFPSFPPYPWPGK